MSRQNNKRQIFLAGGGSKQDSIKIDKYFATALDKSKTLAYIPNAMQKKSYSECLNWLKSVFINLGIKKIEMWTDFKKIKDNDISRISGIYIGGGNTAKLLTEIYKTGFDKILKKIYNAGLPIYGGSAGAIILGQTILTAREIKMFPNAISKGLNLLNDFSAYCHYNGKSDLKKLSQNLNTTIIAIPEKSGVCITNAQLEVIGYKSVSIFTSHIKIVIQPGKIYQIGKFENQIQ